MRLYIEGHNHALGYIVSVELSGSQPVRHYTSLRHAKKVVDRFNRRFSVAVRMWPEDGVYGVSSAAQGVYRPVQG